MKTLTAITVAILLGLGGAAMASDSGENHQDNTNTTGGNPFMPEFNAPAPHGSAAFAKVQAHHAANQHIKR